MKVSSGGITWLYTFDSAELVWDGIMSYGTSGDNTTAEAIEKYQSEYLAWVNAFENVIRDSVLNMSDGSVRGVAIPNETDFEDGMFIADGFWVNPLELSQLVSITIGEKTYSIK